MASANDDEASWSPESEGDAVAETTVAEATEEQPKEMTTKATEKEESKAVASGDGNDGTTQRLLRRSPRRTKLIAKKKRLPTNAAVEPSPAKRRKKAAPAPAPAPAPESPLHTSVKLPSPDEAPTKIEEDEKRQPVVGDGKQLKRKPAWALKKSPKPPKALPKATEGSSAATTTTKEKGEKSVDGRTKNKGAAKRESYSVAFKAKMLKAFDDWESEQKANGKKAPTVRDFVMSRNLGQKFEQYLSPKSGWRAPKCRERILQDASITDYQHMARMPDRSKSKSHYADMEEALIRRLADCHAKNITVSTKKLREMAREELAKLTTDEEKINGFKASNGWVYNFLKRQGRKAKDMAIQQKIKKKEEQQRRREAEEGAGEKGDAAKPAPDHVVDGETDAVATIIDIPAEPVELAGPDLADPETDLVAEPAEPEPEPEPEPDADADADAEPVDPEPDADPAELKQDAQPAEPEPEPVLLVNANSESALQDEADTTTTNTNEPESFSL